MVERLDLPLLRFEFGVACLEVLAVTLHGATQTLLLDRVRDRTLQTRGRDARLGEVVARTRLEKFDGDGVIPLTGQCDDRTLDLRLLQRTQDRQSIGRSEVEVEEDHIDVESGDPGERFLAARELDRLDTPVRILLEEAAHHHAIDGVIVDRRDLQSTRAHGLPFRRGGRGLATPITAGS